MKYTKLFYFISKLLFTFQEKLSEKLSKGEGAASAYRRQERWREIHAPLWLLIRRIIFLLAEKDRFLTSK